MTYGDIARVQFLDWLHDFKPQPPAEMAEVGQFFPDGRPAVEDERFWMDAIRGLHADELIVLHTGLEFWPRSVLLTATGRDEVQRIRARRQDQGARDAACRNAVVRWLNGLPGRKTGQDDMEPFFSTPFSWYEGVQFEPTEVKEALAYLEKRGLVWGFHVAEEDHPIQPALTEDGIDCASDFGGDVRSYLRRSEGARVSNYTNFGNVTGSAVSIGNVGDTTQTVNTAASVDDLGSLLREIVDAAPTLGLSERDAAGLRNAAEAAGAEASSDEQ